MPAYNFKSQFAPAVEAGTKLCTIRGRAAKVGTTAYLYTGMRTKACGKLGQGKITYCRHIQLKRSASGAPYAVLQGRVLSDAELYKLAKSDGFFTANGMMDWFETTYECWTILPSGDALVFEGYMITWELDK